MSGLPGHLLGCGGAIAQHCLSDRHQAAAAWSSARTRELLTKFNLRLLIYLAADLEQRKITKYVERAKNAEREGGYEEETEGGASELERETKKQKTGWWW